MTEKDTFQIIDSSTDNVSSTDTVSDSGGHHSHHHHSHHSHHHSSKHKKRKRGKEKKFYMFLRKNKKYLFYVGIAVILCGALVAVGMLIDRQYIGGRYSGDLSWGDGVAVTNGTIQLESSYFEEDVVIVGPAVDFYYKADTSVTANAVYKEFRTDKNRLDQGLPVCLSYSALGLPEGKSVKGVKLLVSENENLDEPMEYTLSEGRTKVDVYYLKTGTVYYYRFDVTLSDGEIAKVGGRFKTAQGPRVLSVEGVANMRDIGGWNTSDGKRIKQGILYRGAELDGVVEKEYKITENGVNTMLSTLGIKTDMDLRSVADNPHGIEALGNGVEHIYYGAPMYSAACDQQNKETIRQIFSDLADESKYPIYMHCTHGMDRTGTICYLLEALLGMNEDELMKEYSLSVMYHGSAWGMEEMLRFIDTLKHYEGNTLQKNTENYLLSVGVTAEEIQSIRNIFLEEN